MRPSGGAKLRRFAKAPQGDVSRTPAHRNRRAPTALESC
jgi:hypothetical protein